MPEQRVPEYAERDFTASAFILNQDNEILLVKHSKLETWIQPGGHIEENETPDETALRKAIQETGYEIELMDSPDFKLGNSENLPRPFNINIHPIKEDHFHCDFCYLAEVRNQPYPERQEHEDQKWFSRNEIKELTDIPENVRKTALDAMEKASTDEKEMDLAAGAFIVKDGRLLLIKHSKLGKWVHPGGHIEANETPEEAAKRESREETGFKIELVNKPELNFGDSKNLPKPFNINLHKISENHTHCEFRYLARTKGKAEATTPGEREETKWFKEEELNSLENIPENVKKAGMKAIKELEK